MTAKLTLPYEGEEVDDREDLTEDLRRALPVPGVAGQTSVSRIFPANGRRSFETIAPAITVALTSATTLRLVVNVVKTWLVEKNRHSIRIEVDSKSIEITGGSEESQREQVEKFLALFEGRRDSIELGDD